MGEALFPWGWPLIGRDTGATLLEYILRVDWSMLAKDNIKGAVARNQNVQQPNFYAKI